jgi:hypothetical protein
MDEDPVSKGVCAVGDASQKLCSPESRDLKSHDGHQRKVDEPDETGGAKVKEELKTLLLKKYIIQWRNLMGTIFLRTSKPVFLFPVS